MIGLYLFLGAVVSGAHMEFMEQEGKTVRAEDQLGNAILGSLLWPLLAGAMLQSKAKQGDQ